MTFSSTSHSIGGVAGQALGCVQTVREAGEDLDDELRAKTNNAAERALRGPVIHRKLSHGTRSEDGERCIERILSASVTCRLQGRSLYSYMRELLSAHFRGDPLPTLV